MEEGLLFLIWTATEMLLVSTGAWVVKVLSAGRWQAEQLRKDEGRIHGPAGALSFKRDGQRVITVTGLYLVGILFYLGSVLLVMAVAIL